MPSDAPPPTPLQIWALVDDRAGNASQCLGVAEALGLPFLKQDLAYTAAGGLPNFIMGPTFGHVTQNSRVNLMPPWPDLVIAAGRRTAPVARNIKLKNDGKTFLVQIMHPGDAGADEFDMIAVPRHDGIKGANILPVTGAPHRVTPARLAREAAEWAGRFDHLPRPWVAVIAGGSTKRRTFTPDMARDLGARASALAGGAGGSVLLTTSRRTGEAAADLIDAITVPRHVYRWGDGAENPYFAYLALADAVIVTGESGSMCSEACAAPAPVYIYAPKKLVPRKFTLLHDELYRGGYARPLGDTLETWHHPPLNAADDIAAAVRERLKL
ncbi:MAG: mitochondrial fission ELM1 family protein [Hyphomicrobiales bacterium]|nr:mitochondrial fission ELM1 family protein [Hyphomicrobiales bacterium]